MGKRDGLITPNSPRSRLIFKPYARSSSGLKAHSGRGSCDFRRNPWHWRDRTPQEDRIKGAYQRGGDLDKLVVNYHIRPELLMRILELDPVEHPEMYASMLKTYNDLRARALR